MKSNLTTTEKKLIENIARKERTRPEDWLIMHYQKTERVGFEPTNSFPSNDFESFALNHSATFPSKSYVYKNRRIVV